MAEWRTCQDCGARGLEDDSDLMPGTCPPCFQKRIHKVFVLALSPAPAPLVGSLIEALIAGLVEAGCKPERIRPVIERRAREAGLL